MFGDIGTTAHDRFGGAFLSGSTADGGMPWRHGAKVLLWIGLGVAGWAVAILAGYSVWSAL